MNFNTLYKLVKISPEEQTEIPEKRLLRAVMERAIRDLLGIEVAKLKYGADGRITREVKEWLQDESKEPFSFLWLCEELGFRPEKLKDWLARVDKKALDSHRQRKLDIIMFGQRNKINYSSLAKPACTTPATPNTEASSFSKLAHG